MCLGLISFSTWVENNSGQIQIIIAMFALAFAWLAYQKVLHQIKISDKQTDLTIAQMEKLSKERLFELKLKLISRISDHSKILSNLQNGNNELSQRLQVLVIETEMNYPESLEAIKGLEECFRMDIQKVRDVMRENSESIRFLKKQINEEMDIEKFEIVLMELEENQMLYDSITINLENKNKSIDQFWNGLKTGDALASAKITNNLM